MNNIDKLPTSYADLNYKSYIKIIQTIPAEMPNGWDVEEYNSYLTLVPLSVLLDIPVIDLERLPATELVPMLQKIQFLNEAIPPVTIPFEVKSESELTYDEFVTYQKLRLNQWDNMPQILNIIVKDVSPEQIENFSIPEVVAAFFILSKSTKKSIQSLKISLAKKLIVQGLKAIWQKIKALFRVW